MKRANSFERGLVLACLLALPAAAQPLKIAVAGLQHAHIWLNLGAMLKGNPVQLVGVADAAPEQREWARNSAPVGYTRGQPGPLVPDESLIFTDWKKMIDQTKPDIVWAFTPTNEHLDVVRYCAPKGIHVMMEKPLAATYEQALEIQALARKYHVLVMVNYGSTWQPAQYAIKAAIDAGEIGPVWRLHAMTGSGGPGNPKNSAFAAWLADPVKNGGGALMDFGCYSVLWSLWLKGRAASETRHLSECRRQCHDRAELQRRPGASGGDLGPAPTHFQRRKRDLRAHREHRRKSNPQGGRACRRTRHAARRSDTGRSASERKGSAA
jgi:predicted dehydrogenase